MQSLRLQNRLHADYGFTTSTKENNMGKKIDWLYHRKNCTTCTKAEEWRGDDFQIVEQADARKERYDETAALKLARSMDRLIVAKGKAVHDLKLKDKPTDEEILALIMGPTGNLRAPAAKVGKTLLVGFSEEAYERVLG
jgi:arsenate reductase-like glutaredoxin family protein